MSSTRNLPELENSSPGFKVHLAHAHKRQPENLCTPTFTTTLKGSKFAPAAPPPVPKGSNAARSEDLLLLPPLKARPAKPSSEAGREKAAKGSLVEVVLLVEANGSGLLSSLVPPAPPPSSATSSRCELVLKPLRLLTGLLDPAYKREIDVATTLHNVRNLGRECCGYFQGLYNLRMGVRILIPQMTTKDFNEDCTSETLEI